MSRRGASPPGRCGARQPAVGSAEPAEPAVVPVVGSAQDDLQAKLKQLLTQDEDDGGGDSGDESGSELDCGDWHDDDEDEDEGALVPEDYE